MKSKTRMIIVLVVALSVLVSVSVLTMMRVNMQGNEYEDFCEERDMKFDNNFRDPVCYKIDNGNIDTMFIARLNGEIYIR